MIGVEDALANPDVLTTIDVVRRKEAVTNRGRSATVDTTFDDVPATVCAASPSQLERLPEGDRQERYISIVSQFRLQGACSIGADVYKPDLVQFQGAEFVVVDVQPYAHAGSGFSIALAGAGAIVDPAP